MHAPPSHLVTSLDELLALDAANDALGTARKAAIASAMPIFVTMVIPPFRMGKIAPSQCIGIVTIYTYTRVSFARTNNFLEIRCSFLPIFTDVHVTMNAGS